MKPSEVLARARTLLFEGEWSPNAQRGPSGPRCAFYALLDASKGEGHQRWVSGQLLAAAAGCDSPWDILKWNNAPGRTFSEVIDAFDDAIILAKEREAL